MQEVVVNFVIRMAFLLGDAIKDPDFLVGHFKAMTKAITFSFLCELYALPLLADKQNYLHLMASL